MGRWLTFGGQLTEWCVCVCVYVLQLRLVKIWARGQPASSLVTAFVVGHRRETDESYSQLAPADECLCSTFTFHSTHSAGDRFKSPLSFVSSHGRSGRLRGDEEQRKGKVQLGDFLGPASTSYSSPRSSRFPTNAERNSRLMWWYSGKHTHTHKEADNRWTNSQIRSRLDYETDTWK